MSASSKWKIGLLKTGLPLEYVTAKILNKLGHEILGEYPYLRPNENKELKEFSVDIRTFKCLDSNQRLILLSTLIECKYRQPGTSWIFSPFPNDTFPIGLVQSSEDLAPVRFNNDSIWEFEKKLGYCISGIELDSNGNGKTDSPKHGVFQLRFAMPVLLKHNYEQAIKHNWSEGRFIELLCPILVTTSDIRVIKYNTKLETFVEASELDDVTDLKEAIILNERPGPQLQEFADSLADNFIAENTEINKRLSDLDDILIGKEWENRSSPDIGTIKRSFGYSTERILIINHKYLEKVIVELEDAISDSLKSEKIYGKIIDTGVGLKVTSK